MLQIDREKTTPFLVQIFPSATTQHHPDSAFTSSATPVAPLNLYAWKDTTVRELLLGINQLVSIVQSTRYDLTLLYHNSNTQRFNSKHFSAGNYHIRDLTLAPSNNPKLEKTLLECNFEVGDYLDLVHLSPSPLPSLAPGNPSSLYADRNTTFGNRQPPTAPGGLRNQPFNPRNSFPTSNGGPRGAPGGSMRNGNGNAPMRDGNAPAGAWGRNGGGGDRGVNAREDRGGRDGPPHRADTWAPNRGGNGGGGRGSFDSRDGARDNNRRPFNTSNSNNRRDSRSRSPARRPNNTYINSNNRRSPSRSRSRSRSRSPAPRKMDNEDGAKKLDEPTGEGKAGVEGDVEMS